MSKFFNDSFKIKHSEIFKVIINDEKGYSNYQILNIINEFTSNNRSKVKILLVGEVQSGKTKNIIDLINCSFSDTKYTFDIIIIFGGTTINLNNQTEVRFNDPKCELKNNIHVKFKKFSSLYSEKDDGHKTVIYIGPKIEKELENIRNTIVNIPNLKEKRILIIDDECDYGSINTKQVFDATKYSAIIDEIYSLICNHSALISITATPYANLLNKKHQFYDFLFTFPCKNKYGYTGVTFFNQLENFYIDIDNKHNWQNNNLMHSDERKRLYFVFSIYIINTLIKQQINMQNHDKSDLLINTTYVTKEHKTIFNSIQAIINECKSNLLSFINHLKTVSNNFDKKIEINNDQVMKILNNVTPIVLNSLNKSNARSNYNIYIGGVLLSRGITYEHLTVEYITNLSKSKISTDTLLQMCRWFGYRPHLNEFNYMNVITTNTCISAFKEIEQYNKIFFDYESSDDLGGQKNISDVLNHLNELEENSWYVQGCSERKK